MIVAITQSLAIITKAQPAVGHVQAVVGLVAYKDDAGPVLHVGVAGDIEQQFVR